LLVFVCCGCSAVSVKTEVASTKWRMENLEQRFLDFREQAAMREAGLSSRISKLEKELGLPVPTQEEMIYTSTELTPDVHVFVMNNKKSAQKTPAKTADTDDEKKPVPSGSQAKADTALNIPAALSEDKAYEVDVDKQNKNAADAVAFFAPDKSSGKKDEDYESEPVPQTAPKRAPMNATAKPAAMSPATAPMIPAPQKKQMLAPRMEKEVIAAVATPVSKPKAAPKPRKSAKKLSAKDMYKKGLALLNKEKYEAGREQLEEFLIEYPKNALTPNAVYWIGESFYSQKDFAVAIDLFREVVRRFPQHPKARAALLKIGFAYERLNEISDARATLLNVVEQYPTSNEARLARKMLSSI
ncbi:MAG: tol-pal system protein YbgF, partial [Spirochaetales bacterium]|nr:tol-pal system protein YbgF [Spirochaetales bacterium]